MLPSIVAGGRRLRRLAFRPDPGATLGLGGIGITFWRTSSRSSSSSAIQQIAPRAEWLLVPLLAELYLFRSARSSAELPCMSGFRDIGQVWELAESLLFFACAIFFPIGILPVWAQKIAFLNPFVQVMQDTRHVLLGSGGPYDVSARVYAGFGGRRDPDRHRLGLAFVAAVMLFRREGRSISRRSSEWRRSRSSAFARRSGSRTSSGRRSRSTSCIRCTGRRTSGTIALDDVTFAVECGRVLRDRRAERQRQEHAARILAGIYRPGRRHGRGSTACSRRSSSSASASTPSSPPATTSVINGDPARAHAAEQIDERFDEIVALRRARALRRPEAEELLVGHAGAARVLDRDPGRLRRPPARRGARGRRRQLPAEVLHTFERFRREGRTVVLVTHQLSFCERSVTGSCCLNAVSLARSVHRTTFSM